MIGEPHGDDLRRWGMINISSGEDVMPNILDPKFKYTPSFATDIRETFKKAKAGSVNVVPAALSIPNDGCGYWFQDQPESFDSYDEVKGG